MKFQNLGLCPNHPPDTPADKLTQYPCLFNFFHYSLLKVNLNPVPCRNIGCWQMFDHLIKWQHHYNKCGKNKPSVKYELKDGTYLCNNCGRSFIKQSNASPHVQEPCQPKGALAQSYSFYSRVCKKSFTYKCRQLNMCAIPK